MCGESPLLKISNRVNSLFWFNLTAFGAAGRIEVAVSIAIISCVGDDGLDVDQVAVNFLIIFLIMRENEARYSENVVGMPGI